MAFVDIMVIPVPLDRLDDYLELARQAAVVWRDHGALSVQEAVADDLSPGKVSSFPRAVQLQDGETVVVTHVLFADKDARDRIGAAAYADPRMQTIMEHAPVDGARMFWCGFTVMVQA
jgi:uncharacterized protein YbaA (DUF1428 family)